SPQQREGRIMFQRDKVLMSQRFDEDKLQLTGEAVPIAQDVFVFGASPGLLAYRAGSAGATRNQLLWYDRHGKPLGQFGPTAGNFNLRLAPDGKSVLLDRFESNGISHIWIGDLARDRLSRLNPGDSSEIGAFGLPGGRVAYTYSPPGVLGDIYVTTANGAGSLELWVKSENVKHVNDVSPVHGELTGSSGYRSLVQASTVPPPPVRTEISW